MSQQDLAVELEMSAAAVTKWERGLFTPKRETALRIDDALRAGGEILAACGYLAEPVHHAHEPRPAPTQLDEAGALRRLIALQAVQLEQLTSRVEDLDAELRLLRLAVGRGAADSA